LHATGRHARRRLLLLVFPQSRRQRSNALPPMQLALAILVESGSIAIQC
jgi:hypothetical protein